MSLSHANKELAARVLTLPSIRRNPSGGLVLTLDRLEQLLNAARAAGEPWTRQASDQVRDLHASNNALLERARAAEAENEKLRDAMDRVLSSAQLLAAELEDPGTEALAAIHCGRQLVPLRRPCP